MSSNVNLPISNFVVINVSVAQSQVQPRPFNQGLIIGPSAVIPSYGANARIRSYASLAAMLTDGFTNTEPEYIGAELYFSQEAVPNLIWIGRA